MSYEMKSTLLVADTGIAAKYDPVISEHFNNEVTFYAQTPHKRSESLNYRFVARVTRNTQVGPKTSLDDIIGGSSGRINLYSLLRQYTAAVAVEDARVIEATRNGIGPLADSWASEMNDAMIDLSKNLNTAFVDSGTTLGSAFGDAVDSLGAILQTTGNIYGQARSAYASLTANVNTTVGDLSLTKLRSYMITLRTNGARKLIMYTTPIVAGYIRNKMEAQKMYITTSSEIGFVGDLVFDGVIIHEDVDIDTGYMFILDRDEYHIAEFIPFTLG